MCKVQATDEVSLNYLTFYLIKFLEKILIDKMKSGIPEAVFLVVCDPFLNEL